MNNEDYIRVKSDRLHRYTESAFRAVGLPEADANKVANLMLEADLQGSDGHGIIRVPRYVGRILAGGMNCTPNIQVVQDKPSVAVLDGDNGMGHLVMSRAAEIAIEKAKKTGIGWVGARHSNHAGPASLYARMPMQAGMIGLYFAVGNANHLPPWGGITMLLSTNPIAAAFPAASEPPIVLDMATTVTSYGKVKVKAKKGEMMPEGWMVDRQGKPLLDPKRADDGFLLPIAGHKGYGLSLMVGLLSGTLNGAAMGKNVIDFNADDVTTTNTGHAVVAIDLNAFGSAQEFMHEVDTLSRDIRASERLPGVERVWLPGEQSHYRRLEYSREGVPIPAMVVADLNALAEKIGIAKL